MAKGKIPFMEPCPKFSFIMQLSQCYFTDSMKENCFLGFGMTISLVSLARGSRKQTKSIF